MSHLSQGSRSGFTQFVIVVHIKLLPTPSAFMNVLVHQPLYARNAIDATAKQFKTFSYVLNFETALENCLVFVCIGGSMLRVAFYTISPHSSDEIDGRMIKRYTLV
ncbi:hypothetical protein AVEN_241141-1 [Araneus ventricosus]|uniref:Uncharacterized protein n=1 Tax=Araneus ventricosus TaxID=182803 RepID=A0A4Y2W926_ARAVE|nr:hypothetical protein AVEN_241141-1 [Araneus ventricosus]